VDRSAVLPLAVPAGSLIRNLLAPVALVALCAFVALVAWGVAPGDVVRFAVFESLFVFAPGWLLYKALMPRVEGVLRPFAAGWALGYALVILAYLACAAAGWREAFVAYVPLALIVLAPAAWLRRAGPRPLRWPEVAEPRAVWALAAVCVVVVLFLGLGYFPGNPLPGTVDAVSYSADTPWHLGNAVEARFHWPITDPRVAGEPFPYYTFVYLYLAAVNQVTGIALPVLLLRLYFIQFSLLNAVQLYALGRVLGGRHAAGALAAAAVLLVGELDPFPTLTAPFQDYFINSPTTFLGMILFVPLALELGERLVQPGSWIAWAPVVLLLISAAGTKAVLLPIVGAGLGLFFVIDSWLQRRVNWGTAFALGLTGMCYLFFSRFVYGGSAAVVVLKPLDALNTSQLVAWIGERLALPGAWLALAAAPVLLGALGVRAMALGWLARRGLSAWRRSYLWLGALALAALGPYYLFAVPYHVQFWTYFYVLASVLAALGFYELWRSGVRPGRPLAAALLVLLACGLVDKPLDIAARGGYRLLQGRPVYGQENRNLTAGLYAGLAWIRDNTPVDVVIAVNHYYVDAAGVDPRYFDYSAFAERRVFLEGWGYTTAAHRLGYFDVVAGKGMPYPERLDLNTRAFAGDAGALATLARDYGVAYLVVDRVHGSEAPALDTLTRRVYNNSDISVYEIKP
jgi:hypothetical protein